MLKTLIYLCILVHWGWYGIAAMGAVVFLTVAMWVELRSSLRNFESQNEYGYKPCIKRRFQNAETLQSRNQKNSS